MTRKFSKRLVIDACVARASGGEGATYPTSKRCRDFLQAVNKICHRIIMNPDIEREWKSNQSGFARKWLVEMKSHGKICNVNTERNNELLREVKKLNPEKKVYEEIEKDIHLIEAAMNTDQIIISLDEKIRGVFATSAKRVDEFKKITWVNPDKVAEEDPISWLQQGARFDKKRRLEFHEK